MVKYTTTTEKCERDGEKKKNRRNEAMVQLAVVI